MAEEEVTRTKAELQQARDEVRTHTSVNHRLTRLPWGLIVLAVSLRAWD